MRLTATWLEGKAAPVGVALLEDAAFKAGEEAALEARVADDGQVGEVVLGAHDAEEDVEDVDDQHEAGERSRISRSASASSPRSQGIQGVSTSMK